MHDTINCQSRSFRKLTMIRRKHKQRSQKKHTRINGRHERSRTMSINNIALLKGFPTLTRLLLFLDQTVHRLVNMPTAKFLCEK